MLQSKTPLPQAMDYDLRKTVGENRLHSMWLIMTGYRTIYSVAALCTGFAVLANTGTFLLLRYFIDNWLGVETPAVSLWGIWRASWAGALAGFLHLHGAAAGCAEGYLVAQPQLSI